MTSSKGQFGNSPGEAGIIMGSDSDLKVMRKAAELLQELQISHEITVVSAHRTPERMQAYAETAADRGLRVIIAGAGGAAHLPGMVASMTLLPVIGVPISATELRGEDALLSIAQMPAGVPVATVAIDNAANAALLAARILALTNAALTRRLAGYREQLQKEVLRKAAAVEAGS